MERPEFCSDEFSLLNVNYFCTEEYSAALKNPRMGEGRYALKNLREGWSLKKGGGVQIT